MEGTTISSSLSQSQNYSAISQNYSPRDSETLLVINSLNSDSVNVGGSLAETAVTYTAQQISDKITEFLKSNYPDQFTGLSSEEITSEKAASNVIDGLKMLYEAFKKQSESEGREGWQEKFFEMARQGIQTGYDSALEFLDGLGAFAYDGVKSNAEQTKILIEEKLKLFEESVMNPPSTGTAETPENGSKSAKTLSLVA